MSRKSSSKKIENDFFSTGNGQVVMSAGHNTTTEKSKVDFIYGAVPSRSKNDILLVLQSCDYNVDAAISIFSQGQAEEVLNQWSYKGKRNKEGNKKKRNKKKQANKESKEVSKPVLDNEDKQHPVTNGTDTKTNQAPLVPAFNNPTTLTLDLPSVPEKAPNLEVNGVQSANSNESVKSTKDLSDKKPSALHKSETSHHVHSSSHLKHHKPPPPKPEKLSPTSNTDALKRSTKDLSRSSFSLARYQVVLEEECEQSLKKINKTFENIKNCIREREETLIQTLSEFKERASKLLQQRSEDAAALKLKTDRVNSMSDEQVALLRADIKSFVAERKFDEELAQTKRFVCDEEKFIQELKTFGQVVPIKNTYTPVILNHPTPTPKSTSTSVTPVNHPKAAATITLSSNKTSVPDNKLLTNKETALVSSKTSITEPKDLAAVKPVSSQESAVKVKTIPVSKESGALHKSSKTNIVAHPVHKASELTSKDTTGPPPKISTLISLAMAKSSAVASDGSKEQQQGASDTSERKRGGEGIQHKESSRNQHNRPNTAPAQHDKQQRNRESRPKRPQTNRQTRQDKDSQDDKAASRKNEVSKAYQSNAPGKSEINKQKPRQETQSEHTQEGGRRRPRRRGGRDRKPKTNEETNAAKDNTDLEIKKSVDDAVTGQQETTIEKKCIDKDSHQEDLANTEENRQPSLESENIQSTDSALPQRSPRPQNRRRNRNHAESTKAPKMSDVNGIDHSNQNGKEEKGSPVKEFLVEESPFVEPPVEELPVKESPTEELPEKEFPVTVEAPVEGSAIKVESPVEESPDEGSTVEESPVEESLIEESAIKESPVEESPVEESPDEGSTVEESPVEESLIEESLIEESAIKESPVEESPVEESPVEESPVEESPVKESPVKESLIEESPVEGSPVKESLVKEFPVKDEEEEKVVAKIAQVVAPAHINGLEISSDGSNPVQHSQINGYTATNGAADDCLVER